MPKKKATSEGTYKNASLRAAKRMAATKMVKKRIAVKEESPKHNVVIPHKRERVLVAHEKPMKRRKVMVKEQLDENDATLRASDIRHRGRPPRSSLSNIRHPSVKNVFTGRSAAVKEESDVAGGSSPRKNMYYALPPKLSANRPYRKLGTQIGMPGDEKRIPTNAELNRILTPVQERQAPPLRPGSSSVGQQYSIASFNAGRIPPPPDDFPASMLNPGVSSPRRRILGYEPQLLVSSRKSSAHKRSDNNGNDDELHSPKRSRTFTDEHNETYERHYSNLPADKPRPVVTTYHSHSEPGRDPDAENQENQDCCWTLSDFGNEKSQYFFGVSDGHGTNGHNAARLVASQLPQYLHSTMEFPKNIIGAFKRAFKTTDEDLRKSMNAKFSGCTAATLLIREKKAYGAFVGDSRGFIGRRENKAWTAVPVSREHKPDLPEEKKRIEAAGGRVHPHECDTNGRHRVWLKTKDGPGLAMSRSFGDSVVSRVGVCSEPEIIEVDLQFTDKFFILATDGVWDVMSNEEVIALIEPYCGRGDAKGAVNAIISEANRRYMAEEGNITDDTTVVLGFLDVPKCKTEKI